MRRHNQRLFRIIRSVLTNDTEAEDVLQETWVRAYEHLGQFEGRAVSRRGRPRSLITKRGARPGRKALDPGREPRRRRHARSEPPAIVHRNARSTGDSRPVGRLLQSAVDGLPETYRTVFVLREVEQLSTIETADSLGLSEEAVKTRLHRSRALLRRELQEQIRPAVAESYAFLGARCDRTVTRVLERIHNEFEPRP